MDFDIFIKNNFLYGLLILSIILYIQFVKINPNPKITKFLNSNLFRLFMFTLIAFIATKNILVSIILSISFVSILIILQKQKLIEYYNKSRMI